MLLLLLARPLAALSHAPPHRAHRLPLTPAGAHPFFSHPHRPAAARAAPVHACDVPEYPPPPAMLGGKPVVRGDMLMHRDDESNAWWRATALDVAGSRVRLHYLGCDDSWDTWVEVDELTLMRMDADERAKEKSGAFQTEDFEASLDDEELLAQMRKKRWDDNARWQLSLFAKAQGGEFVGTSTEYELNQGDDGNLRFKQGEETDCKFTATLIDEGATMSVVVADQMTPQLLGVDLQADYQAFTPQCGNMAVANAYTMAQADADGSILLELALKEDIRRVRCKLLYSAVNDGERKLQRVAVVRESMSGSTPFAEASETDVADIDGSPGRGLYDPPAGAHDGSAYATLYCDSGVTIKFPTSIPISVSGYISLDWIAGQMRYQLDRKFATMDGSLASLELTEISNENSQNYPPPAKP